jgi:Domain of unknown function (DUF4760)
MTCQFDGHPSHRSRRWLEESRRRNAFMVQPTYDDANLLLRLYELRREEKLRKARHWFLFEFSPTSWKEIRDHYFTGEEEDNYIRMVGTYWDMTCALVQQGVLNKELFYTTNGEHLTVWSKIKPWVEEARKARKNPLLYRNLEDIAEDTLQWRQRQMEKYSA